ncbi:MAG: 5-formyltetrahydrofolate cyclo-ligase [Rhodobacteraceae bacterium]|nr:5-formyltetrahydrofolate cyclo-ligase [Paracoccaceae bacterium]
MSVSAGSLAEQKNALRRHVLAKRAAMSVQDRVEQSLALVAHLDALLLPDGAIVAGFWPIRDEIDPRPLLDGLRKSGHRLCLPIVADPHLLFREFGPDTAFESAGFGTMGPSADAPQVYPDVLLMPLAGFDSHGNRLGYGKGHYDTAIAALKKKSQLLCIGIAFSIQELDHVPAEPHDEVLDGILTEQGYRRFGPDEVL